MTAGERPAGASPRGAGAADAPARIVLVLGGSASLGAYVAGAVSELLEAIEADPDARARVHVIAGRSAGALTAAMAARALTVNPGLLPWLRTLWVELLDIEALLDPGRSDPGALLDGGALDELGRLLIAGEPAADDRPARGTGDPLRLGIALSSLTGVPRRLRYRSLEAPDRSVALRTHADAASFELGRGTRAGTPVWEEIRRAATASAALPFAWPPRRLERGGGSDRDGAAARAWYADGGLLGEGAIGLAKRLVERYPDHRSARWVYVLVDPRLGEGLQGGPPPDTPTRLAGALARALLGEAAGRDWIGAVDTNARVQLFEGLVRRLPELADGLCDPGAFELGRRVARLAEHVAQSRTLRAGGAPEDEAMEALDCAVDRIESDPRFRDVLARTGTRAARTRLAKLIYVLEAVADLEDKQVLALHLIAPRPGEPLAGAFLGDLGGFLGAAWRAHDFEAGRRDAARLLRTRLDGLVRYDRDPEEIRPPEAPPPSLEGGPPEARERIDRYVDLETDRLLASVEPGPFGRLLAFAWKPALRSWVRRRVRSALERAAG